MFVPIQFKIDIVEELKKLLNTKFELIILSSIRQELEEISKKGSPKMRKKAAFALEMAEKFTLVEPIEESSNSSPDESIFQMARKWKCLVFTNDKELRKRLRNINTPVIYVRQKSRLEINGRT